MKIARYELKVVHKKELILTMEDLSLIHILYNEGILHHKEGVDIIPTNIELSGMEISLVNAMSREPVSYTHLSRMIS